MAPDKGSNRLPLDRASTRRCYPTLTHANRPGLATIGLVLIAALALSACGRKGALEPPPGTVITAPAPTAKTRPLKAQAGATATVVVKPNTSEPVPPQKNFFLDWLL